MEHMITSKETAFAVFSALSIKHTDRSKLIEGESKIAKLIESLTFSELTNLSSRGVVSITIQEDVLKREIDYCQKISAREERINTLILNKAPLPMMKTLGITERKFIDLRKHLNVEIIYSRPKKPTEDEINLIAIWWQSNNSNNKTLDQLYLDCHKKTGLSLQKIWQGVKEINEINKGNIHG